jgi:hypothetical protein
MSKIELPGWDAYRDEIISNVAWGADHAEAATEDERDILIGSIAAVETFLTIDRWDPTTQGKRMIRTLEAYFLRLWRSSNDELAAYCRRVIDENPEIRRKTGPKRGETGLRSARLAVLRREYSQRRPGMASDFEFLLSLVADGLVPQRGKSTEDSAIARQMYPLLNQVKKENGQH